MKILIDMNLSPHWVDEFKNLKIEAIHWSAVGQANALDEIIFDYAKANDYIIFTHDLDFGAILAATKTNAPSVIQVRDEDIYPNQENTLFIINILNEFSDYFEKGALVTIQKQRTKVRILPILKS